MNKKCKEVDEEAGLSWDWETSQKLLMVTFNPDTMTTTCIGSTLGLQFLHQKLSHGDGAKDVSHKLKQFLSDHYNSKNLKIQEKLLPESNVPSTNLHVESKDQQKSKTNSRARRDKKQVNVEDNDQNENQKAGGEGTVARKRKVETTSCVAQGENLSRSGRKIKIPKWLQNDDVVQSSPGFNEPESRKRATVDKSSRSTVGDFEEDINNMETAVTKKTSTVKKQQVANIKVDNEMVVDSLKVNNDKNLDCVKVDDENIADRVKVDNENIADKVKVDDENIVDKVKVDGKYIPDGDKNVTSGIEMHSCQKCGLKMDTLLERYRHEVIDHNFINLKDACVNDQGNKFFKCPICKNPRKTEKSIELHIQSHFKIDRIELTCQICHLEFKTKNRLQGHVLIHNEPKFPCDVCGKKFRLEKYVRRHKVEVHKNVLNTNKVSEIPVDDDLEETSIEDSVIASKTEKSVVKTEKTAQKSSGVQRSKVCTLNTMATEISELSKKVDGTKEIERDNLNTNSKEETISDEMSVKVNDDIVDEDLVKAIVSKMEDLVENGSNTSYLEHVEYKIEGEKPFGKEVNYSGDENESEDQISEDSKLGNNTTLKCKYCQQKFSKKYNLTRHITRKHSNSSVDVKIKNVQDENDGKQLQCRQCKEVMFSPIELVRHELTVHDLVTLEKSDENQVGFKCPVCKMTRKSPHSIKMHIEEHFQIDVSELTCTICKLQFKTKHRLQSHILIHNEAKYPCNICGKKFRMLKYVRRHVSETHRIELDTDPPKKKDDGKDGERNEPKQQKMTPGICDVCGKSYSSKYAMLQHRTLHTREKPHSCPKCNKSFRLQSSLKNHMFVHQDVKDYICDKCGKSFKIPQGLRMHQLRHHEKVDYKCDICNRKFMSFGGKKYHILKEHKEQADSYGYKLYPCEHCDRVSSSYQEYLKHETSHVDNRSHECEICQGRWATASQLNVHKKSHFGLNKNFHCKICQFKTATPWKLRRHLKSTKHIDNCQAAGVSQGSVEADLLNTDVVETPALRKDQIEIPKFEISEIPMTTIEGQIDEKNSSVEENQDDSVSQTEGERTVEVIKYIELPENLEEGSQIIYADDSGIIYQYAVENGLEVGESNMYVYDPSINQAVESILKLQSS